ncbi:hypothetical protein AA106556_0285 [Neokomagataea tanensis NBRC 106556]|uniref:Transposase n=1 Tax=Neokomagataea tanensis NBRC 106556 TaxID=1223519 RepID=A0ABQ0QGK1_9PROT|nr:hypothetical protein AA106556_0285 [Neokomagataea tanensis NBRC 106556]
MIQPILDRPYKASHPPTLRTLRQIMRINLHSNFHPALNLPRRIPPDKRQKKTGGQHKH